MTVIRYIENESKHFHTYVANHVALIREDSSPSQCRYVDIKSSPADDASRGVSAESFIQKDKGAGVPSKATIRVGKVSPIWCRIGRR